jgi:hypothetical protein
MFRKINKFIHLPAEEKALFFMAVRIASWARFYTAVQPSGNISKIMGVAHNESQYEINSAEEEIIGKICRATRRSSVYLPFKEKCLIEAIVAKKLLKKYGKDSTLYLGVARGSNNELLAHAWLRYGTKIIIGRKGMENYISLEWFA